MFYSLHDVNLTLTMYEGVLMTVTWVLDVQPPATTWQFKLTADLYPSDVGEVKQVERQMPLWRFRFDPPEYSAAMFPIDYDYVILGPYSKGKHKGTAVNGLPRVWLDEDPGWALKAAPDGFGYVASENADEVYVTVTVTPLTPGAATLYASSPVRTVPSPGMRGA